MSISGENEKNSNILLVVPCIFWHLNIPSISLYVLQAQSCPFSALGFLYFLCCIILNPECSISSPRHKVVPSLYPVYASTNFSTVGE